MSIFEILLANLSNRFANIGPRSNIQSLNASIDIDRIAALNGKEKNMKAIDLLVVLSLSVALSGCANYQAGGYTQSGVQALLAGNNQTALSYLQAAAQQDPNRSIDRKSTRLNSSH